MSPPRMVALFVVIVMIAVYFTAFRKSDGLGLGGLDQPENFWTPTPFEATNATESSNGPAAAGQVCEGISREISAIPPSLRSASEVIAAVQRSDLSAAADTGSADDLMVLDRLVAYLGALEDATSLRARKDEFLEASEVARISSCVDLARALPPNAATR